MIDKIEDIVITDKMYEQVFGWVVSWVGIETDKKSIQKINLKSAIQSSTQIQELIAENKRLREANEWRPIETAPRNGDWVIVWAKPFYPRQVGFSKELQQWVVERVNGLSVILDFEPTHWKPLPQPPKEQNND